MAGLNQKAYIELAVAGLPDGKIAELSGVSAGYVSQLASNEDVQKAVAEGRAEAVGDGTLAGAMDNGYDNLEFVLLQKLTKSINFLTKPQELTRILQFVNAAKRRRGPLSQQVPTHTTIVQLQVPIALHNRIVISDKAEITEVDGRKMQTMPAAALPKLLEIRNANAAAAQTTGNELLDLIELPNAITAGQTEEIAQHIN